MSDTARLVNHRGKWTIRHNGSRYSLGLNYGKSTEAEAKRLKAVWLQSLEAPIEKDIGSFVAAYIAELKEDGKDYKRPGYSWKHLEATFSHLTPELINKQIQREHIKKRRDVEGCAQDTIRTEMNLLRRVVNWAVKERLLSADNKPHIIVPTSGPPREAWLTREQFGTVLEAAKAPHVKLFIVLALTTAARREALLQLQWKNVDLEKREIDLRNHDDDKRRKGRAIVPINDRLYAALEEAQEHAQTDYVVEWAGRPLSKLRHPLERIKVDTGIHVTAHMFRHSAAVWMAQDNIPIQKIAEFLGHSDISVTYKHYARYFPDHLRDAAEVLTW